MVPYSALTPADVGTEASHELAKDAALQGMVLLQNTHNNKQRRKALPLQTGVTTAVLGPLANITLGMMSRYYDAVCPGVLDPERGSWGKGMRPSGCITAPLHRLMARGKVLHRSGYVCADERPNHHCLQEASQAGIAAAVAAAKMADQIVLFLGLDNTIEQEGTDRQSLGLPGAQPALLTAVRKAAPTTPLTVVLLNGGAIAMDYGSADAVVEAFFPGVEGGEAIACALYGEPGCNRGPAAGDRVPREFCRERHGEHGGLCRWRLRKPHVQVLHLGVRRAAVHIRLGVVTRRIRAHVGNAAAAFAGSRVFNGSRGDVCRCHEHRHSRGGRGGDVVPLPESCRNQRAGRYARPQSSSRWVPAY